jgi:hypothetical protein
MFNLNVNFPAILDRQSLCRTSASWFQTQVLQPHVQEVHLYFGRAGGTVGYEACSKNLLAGAKIDWGKVVQPRNHLVQPTVDIGWRQLIFCFVAAKLEQPWATSGLQWTLAGVGLFCTVLWSSWCNLEQPLNNSEQPHQNWLAAAYFLPYCSRAGATQSNLERPLNNMVQPAVNIGRLQLIFCYVVAKLVQPIISMRHNALQWRRQIPDITPDKIKQTNSKTQHKNQAKTSKRQAIWCLNSYSFQMRQE